MKKFTISLTKEQEKYIKTIAFGVSIDEFLEAFINKNLLFAHQSKKEEAVKDNNKNEPDEFEILKNKMHSFGLIQSSITSLLKTSQSSVSYFFVKKHTTSHLYNALMRNKNILFELYVHQHEKEYKLLFPETKAETLAKDILLSQEHLLVVKILAVSLKKGSKRTISEETIGDFIYQRSDSINAISPTIISSKNIKILSQEINKILEK